MLGRVGMTIQKRTAATGLANNRVSPEKASPEPPVSFFFTDEPSHAFISCPSALRFHHLSLQSLFRYPPPLHPIVLLEPSIWLNPGKFDLLFPVHVPRTATTAGQNRDWAVRGHYKPR